MKLKEFLNEKSMQTASEIYGEEGLKLRKFGFLKYKKLEDWSYEVWGNFIGGLKEFPVKIKILHGNFDCSNNGLENLECCPEIVDGYFYKNKFIINCNKKIIKFLFLS